MGLCEAGDTSLWGIWVMKWRTVEQGGAYFLLGQVSDEVGLTQNEAGECRIERGRGGHLPQAHYQC